MNRSLREAASRIIDAYIENLEENISAEIPHGGHPFHDLSNEQLSSKLDLLIQSAQEMEKAKANASPNSTVFRSAKKQLAKVRGMIGAAKDIGAFRSSGKVPGWYPKAYPASNK